MPSFNETFGITYLEAISQGCQIICSEDQGIDGYLNQHDHIYQSVKPIDVSSIQLAYYLCMIISLKIKKKYERYQRSSL